MGINPFGAWTPDMPAHENALLDCKNTVSRTPQSYGPINGLSVYSGALTARAQSAFAARKSDGSIEMFASDATKLYRLTSASTSWSDVSKVSTTYAPGADVGPQFVQFGNYVIAGMGLSDPVQSFTLGSSSNFGDLSAGAPRAKYAAVAKGFLVLGHTYDASDGTQTQRVWWSEIEDPTSWPTPGTASAASAQSDFQDIAGDGGWVQGLVGGLEGADLAILQERALYRAIYVGAPLIFQIDKVEGARGCPAPYSIVQIGGRFFYLGEDNFYVSNGNQSVPISSNRVSKWFFERLDQTYYNRVVGAADPINPLVWWCFPGENSSGGAPSQLIVYNWETDRWTYGELTLETIFRAGSFGYNADNADSLGFNADTSPFGPDSRFWAGGRPLLAAFNADHKLCFFSGSALAATFETGDMDLGEGRRVFVSGLRPWVDGGTVTCAVGYRDTPSASVSYTTATSAGADGFCPQRISTRYARAKMTIAAGGDWDHAKGVEPRFKPEGLR